MLLAVTGLFLQCSPASTSAPEEGQTSTKIQLMTSLPIVWGEGASMESILSGATESAPIYTHWRGKYDISAVDSFEALESSATDVVILAQPPAMDPADIAALDAWIRDGGKAIILTDPLLLWPTELSLGDKSRPLTSGLLSPLLNYWGLELLAPDADGAGQVVLEFPEATITTVGIGTFKPLSGKSASHANCALSQANVIARCNVGEGRAIIIADADFLNDSLWGVNVSEGAKMESRDARRLTDIFVADLIK